MATDQQRSLASLLVSVMNAREQEGARVSRILHDDVGQVLSAIGLQLDLLRMDLNEHVADCQPRILEIQKVLELAVAQVRDLSYELNPSIVERTGLQFALDRLVGRFRKDFAGSIRLLFDSSVRLPLEAATAVYKIAEQALENAVTHSGATRIEVMVKLGKQGISLEVRDNGTGVPEDGKAADTTGLGLHLMRYHANQSGLRFSVASIPEQGTIVRAIFRTARLRTNPIAD
jgi:two-component system, NarL family, sensor kinase